VHMNLAARMKLSGINQLWVADITYIRLAGEFVYLAVVLDAYSRKVVGWELGRNLKASLAVSALRKAIAQRQPSPGLVHHSDRGLQYCSLEYVQLLEQHGIMPSMSRPANPYDNAFCESFMRTLKREEIQANAYRDLEDLRPHLEQFVEQYYNRSRLHSALGYRPPQEFEQLAGAQKRDLAGPPSAARVSFLRHGEIYRWGRETAKTASPAHPIDESPTGYSLAGCSPAVPDSASPAEAMVINDQALGITKNSKQQMRAIKLSQLRGSPHLTYRAYRAFRALLFWKTIRLRRPLRGTVAHPVLLKRPQDEFSLSSPHRMALREKTKQ
jgi:hypothetical protein